MVKLFLEVTFYLFVIAFCFLMAKVPADCGGFTSPYFDYEEMRQSQRIEFEHQELLDYAEDWQVKYLKQIDFESQKALEEAKALKKQVKFDPNGYNGDVFVILGDLDSEINLVSLSQMKLNLESQEFEFKTVLAYWRSFRTHPESPLVELKNYLSQKQAQKE